MHNFIFYFSRKLHIFIFNMTADAQFYFPIITAVRPKKIYSFGYSLELYILPTEIKFTIELCKRTRERHEVSRRYR